MAAEEKHTAPKYLYSTRGPRDAHGNCLLFVLHVCIMFADLPLQVNLISARFCCANVFGPVYKRTLT